MAAVQRLSLTRQKRTTTAAYYNINGSTLNVFSSTYEYCITGRRDGVVNTPASYSGGPVFKSWPADRLY
jgi:hypothetical protein